MVDSSPYRESWRTWARRYGLGMRYRGPHIWVHAEHSEAVVEAGPLLRQLLRENPRYRLMATSPHRSIRAAIAAAFPDAVVLAPPAGGDYLVRRVFGCLRPHLLLVFGMPETLGPAVFHRAARFPLPVILIAGAVSAIPPRVRRRLPQITAFLAWDEDSRQALLAAGATDDKVQLTAADAMLPAIREALRRDWSVLGEPDLGGLVGLGRAVLQSRAGGHLLRRRATAIESLDGLREALGAPRSILCLGNGPSSADPRLPGLAADRLFRVNHRWLAAGFMTAADMVFTGDASSVAVLAPRVFGFRTIEEERQILMRHALRLSAARFRYATAQRLPVAVNGAHWTARPTNGAAMIAVAAALQPQRLIIAGIDLYEHEAGIYPDEPAAPGGYLLLHDRGVELEIIRRALDGFSGEVTVLSEPLARRLGANPPQ